MNTRVDWARKSHVLSLLVLTLVMLGIELTEAQCAMCRTAFASEEGRQLIAAFRSGILFLLAAPFVTFGTVAFLAVRARNSGRRKQGGGPGEPTSA